ncbi:hypothetical protein FRC18_005656 [Serendipita sp. 400]|nr:hypothetical protein FRC18_005656 [Serendipita sp. 400]
MGNHSSVLDVNTSDDIQFILIYYNSRRTLMRLPEDYEGLVDACRRLFLIPPEEELWLNFELDRIVGEHMEIDPQIWSNVRSTITGAWVHTPYYQPRPSRDDSGATSSNNG